MTLSPIESNPIYRECLYLRLAPRLSEYSIIGTLAASLEQLNISRSSLNIKDLFFTRFSKGSAKRTVLLRVLFSISV